MTCTSVTCTIFLWLLLNTIFVSRSTAQIQDGVDKVEIAPSFTPATEAESKSEQPMSFRSSMKSRIWIDSDVGINLGPSLGDMSTGWNLGTQFNLSVGFLIERCGVIANYRSETVYYYDPVDAHTVLGGAGVFCQFTGFGQERIGKQETHLQAHALLQYGKTDYVFEANHTYAASAGHSFGQAGTVGGDVFSPLWFGFWIYGGVDFETNNFKFQSNDMSGNTVSSNGLNYLILYRLGISYSFL